MDVEDTDPTVGGVEPELHLVILDAVADFHLEPGGQGGTGPGAGGDLGLEEEPQIVPTGGTGRG